MKIQFIGGAQTVTGSMHLLTVDGHKVLLECGLFQGRREEMYQKNQNFPFDPAEVEFLLLSHAHIDHSGNIPNLVKKGFRGKILATPPTVDLCKIMLPDSAYIQEMDVMHVNKIRAKNHQPPVEPIYNSADVQACLGHFVPVEYNQSYPLAPHVKVTFRNAGHILGSAGILLEVNEKGRSLRFGFTGDLGRDGIDLINDPDPLRDLDILVTETTYGNRTHPPAIDAEEKLAQLVRQTAQNGGKVIIPAFAVGRTQQIVYHLHKLFDQNRIPDIPVYVDSPLAVKATEIFRDYPQYLDRETERIYLTDHLDPFKFSRLTYVGSVEESKSLNSLVYPAIIISASGMAEGGRILHHLKNNIENPKNLILFVGYSAKNTLARKIMDGEKRVKIFGEEHEVRAQIAHMDTFSAHGDRHNILDYVDFSDPKHLKKIFLVHGEPEQANSLIDAFRSKGFMDVCYPAPGEEHEF
ncbi:MAG: MBL fold metallo-hydrolase [Candidatus Lambdaproteobacteria bacterium RIFOXYD1_FULL_56_27]|uniref:MBL fold metallo-hydrolase n=1 Tax=Candidatus Lambdaproteobacteria bacterium RIFOXYD2_FULL_56_26 TaxID=1817773 RepID=A0A1F6H3D3_9PROT|nr:MAG: MBL fold metallo-hydrolase [Candidatus Lambdaproteobacteria bacterium RIFOXYC1_FULL_56_13]OGH04804.1 MAG: MBL fold metallo-hydrolase [Candidatus Lambdaproteobacteria bacterium RIFOXYD2_FULL_56_26]OGH09269.1 MAG: MBL fold metallo-hydrolase [Candidatus Lambdaproteobacteria bacterium RIFOXYD1_FULL_56_27]